ncbi:MAG: RNA 2',3'-cyclic phosphodiesterase [Candidatus Margulisbacteria bacterium]|nr:RNA 2',3'-cyclic phosphodiesterase [Candidatus Margulisiibacteriota bacterium]
MRTFISVELPDKVKKKAAELINELKQDSPGVKWVSAQDLHITLKFLGWVADEKLDQLIDLTAKAAAGCGSFKARFEGLGTFPAGRIPRVVWVGTAEGGGKLCQLAKDLEQTLSAAGFRSEAREPKPHLTLGRVKDKKGLGSLVKKINSVRKAKFGEALVDRIYIMKSTLTQNGPIYEKYQDVKL